MNLLRRRRRSRPVQPVVDGGEGIAAPEAADGAARLVDDDVPGDPRSVATVEFLEPDVGAALATEGFARIGSFLDPDEVARANEVFAEARRRLAEPLGDQWFPTILLPDDEVRAFITSELSALILPKLERLVDPRTLEAVRLDYSVKPSSPVSELGPHQDFALVDERVAQSLYLWIPLCDTDATNGTLHVVPGSHRFTNRIRSRHVPAVFDEVIDEVHRASVCLDSSAGDLVVMVSGIIHWSPPNRSGDLRLAAHGIVKPVGVPLVFYFQDEQTAPDQVECYELDIERYVRAIHEGRPADATGPDRLEPRPVGSMSPDRFARGIAAPRGLVGPGA